MTWARGVAVEELLSDIFRGRMCVSLNVSEAVEYYAAMKIEPYESVIQWNSIQP